MLSKYSISKFFAPKFDVLSDAKVNIAPKPSRSIHSGNDLFCKIFGKSDAYLTLAQQNVAGVHSENESMSIELDAHSPMAQDTVPEDSSAYSRNSMQIPRVPTFISYESVDMFVACKLTEIENKFRGESGSEESEGCFLCDEVRKSSHSWSPLGRLGPSHAMFDVSTNVGSLIIDCDRLGLSSHSGFRLVIVTLIWLRRLFKPFRPQFYQRNSRSVSGQMAI